MEEEKKVYPVYGTVTISTEEYRDLVLGIAKAENELDKQRSKWYEEYNKANRLQKENETVKAELEKYRGFVESKKELKLAFKFFCAGIDGDEDDA